MNGADIFFSLGSSGNSGKCGSRANREGLLWRAEDLATGSIMRAQDLLEVVRSWEALRASKCFVAFGRLSVERSCPEFSRDASRLDITIPVRRTALTQIRQMNSGSAQISG